MQKGRIVEFMTVEEFKEGMKDSKTVIIPEGVIEQHGFHLPLNTDVFNCYEISKRVSERTGCFVAPPINYSYSGGELPGTINISTSTLSLLLSDVMRAFIVQGFKNIVVLLGHGGTENQRATEEAIDMFMRLNPNYSDVCFAFMPFTSLSNIVEKAFEDHDFHAGYLETSLMLYWHPELVRKNRVVVDKKELMDIMYEDQDAYQVKTKIYDHKFVFPQIRQNPEMEVGVMGFPERASVEYGEVLCNDIVNNCVDFINELENRLK